MFLHTSFESSLFREQNVRFALTNRVGGASVGAFNALNLGFNVGDMFQNVVRNHQKVAMCLYEECHIAQEKRKPLYYMEQIHSAESIVLDEALESRLLESQHLQRGEQDFATRDFKDSICIGKTDAIITHLPYRICLVLVADCNPLCSMMQSITQWQ